MNVILDVIVKPSIVLLLALAAMPLLRYRSAALRHAVLVVALLCAAAVPFAGPLAPAWHVPVGSLGGWPRRTPDHEVVTSETVAISTGAVDVARVAAPGSPAATVAPSGVSLRLFGWIWLIG